MDTEEYEIRNSVTWTILSDQRALLCLCQVGAVRRHRCSCLLSSVSMPYGTSGLAEITADSEPDIFRQQYSQSILAMIISYNLPSQKSFFKLRFVQCFSR